MTDYSENLGHFDYQVKTEYKRMKIKLYLKPNPLAGKDYIVTKVVNTTEFDLGQSLSKQTVNSLIEGGIEIQIEKGK